MKYQDKMSDIRWRLKRERIIKRDGNKCRFCDSKIDLQVHHINYTGEPWEAKDSDLITLCDCCHRVRHRKMDPNGLKHVSNFIYGALAHLL